MLTFGIVSLFVFRITDYFVRKLQNPILHEVLRKRFPDDKVFFTGSTISGVKKVGLIFLVMLISTTSVSILFADIFYDYYVLFDPEFIWSVDFYLGLLGMVFFPLFVLWYLDLRIYFASEMIVQKLERPLLRLVFVIPVFSVARLTWEVFSSSTEPVELFNYIYVVFTQSFELWTDFTMMIFTLSVIFLICFHLMRNDLLEHLRNQGIYCGKIKFENEDVG